MNVFTVYRSEEEKNFNEQSLYIGQELDNVYIRSKFEVEMAVRDAAIDTLDVKILSFTINFSRTRGRMHS